MPPRVPVLLATCAALAAAAPASAQLVPDAPNDFVAGYAGPHNGDMDVLGANVFYTGTQYRFTSLSAGDIRTTTGALFVWGINRGRGTARFGPLAPGVLFDAVVVLNPDLGTVTVNDLINATSTPIPVGALSFSGARLTATIDASLLPRLAGGFARSDYTANLWPRVGAGMTAISDFAPDNSNLAVVTPEPASLALLVPAAGVLAGWARRRRRPAA